MTLKLSIGMASYDDYYNTWSTCQALRMYHPEVMLDTEIIIVDNNPDQKDESGRWKHNRQHSQELQAYMGWMFGRTPEASKHTGMPPGLGGFQYHQLMDVKGTSAPRDLVFRKARGEFVLCMDSHVMLAPGSLKKLIDWLVTHPGNMDLVSGPMLYDGLNTYSTHFDYAWRDQMWGTWGSAWVCRCNRQVFSPYNAGNNVLKYRTIMEEKEITRCPSCDYQLVQIGWAGHERMLLGKGIRPVAEVADFPAFEIPANGLGIFGCRKEAWLGFNEKFRGFGGEEHYIHEKFRQKGRKNLCLPFLRWNHRFGRPGGAPYPASVWNKCRNYVIGHAELGLDLRPVYDMFVKNKLVSEDDWRQLIADPNNPPEWPAGRPQVPDHLLTGARPPEPKREAGTCVRVAQPRQEQELTFEQKVAMAKPQDQRWRAPKETLDEWFDWLKTVPHDFTGHEEQLRKLASESEHVTELGGRRGSSTLCLLAGQPKSLRVVDPNPGSEWPEIMRMAGQTFPESVRLLSPEEHPAATDLLLIDTRHHGEQLLKELQTYGPIVRRRIVIHDTVLHGNSGEEDKPGLLQAMRQFIADNPEWFIETHDGRNYGLTVMSRQSQDKPPHEIILWPKGFGPGTELKMILSSLGINPGSSCDCNGKAEQMDRWGVEGCRKNKDMIVQWMKDGQSRWGWRDKVSAATKAITSGLAFKFNPLDPFPGIIEHAIHRAEIVEQGRKKA